MYECLRILGHKLFFNWVKGILVSSLLDFSFHYLFHKISIHLAQRCSAQKKTCSIPNNVIYVCTSSTFNSFLMTRSSWRIWFTVNSTTELPNFQSTVCKHEIVELVYPCRGYMNCGQWFATNIRLYLWLYKEYIICTRVRNQGWFAHSNAN